jgi:hypothetical protein
VRGGRVKLTPARHSESITSRFGRRTQEAAGVAAPAASIFFRAGWIPSDVIEIEIHFQHGEV